MSEIQYYSAVPDANTEETSKTSSGGSTRWFKTKVPGTYKLRVMPPWSQVGKIGLKVFKQWNIPFRGGETSFIEIEQTFPHMGYTNPIMEVIRKYKKLGLQTEHYEADAYGYLNVKILEAPSGVDFDPNLPYIFETPPFGFDWIVKKNYDPDYANLIDPINGFPVRIDRVKTGDRTSYERQILAHQRGPLYVGPDGSPDYDKIQKFLAELPKLDEIFAIPNDEMWAQLKEAAQNLDSLLATKLREIGGSGASVKTTIPTANQSALMPQGFNSDKKFWVFLNGNTTLITELELRGVVARFGYDTQVMSEDQSSGWKPASFFIPQAPGAPPAPVVAPPTPVAPVPPVMPQNGPAQVNTTITEPQVPQPTTNVAPKVAQANVQASVSTTQVAPPVQPPTSNVGVAPNGTINTNRPQGSPVCFGDASTFAPNTIKCLSCLYQVDCKKLIQG